MERHEGKQLKIFDDPEEHWIQSAHRFRQQIAGDFAILHRQEQSYLEAAPPPRLLPPARSNEATADRISGPMRKVCK